MKQTIFRLNFILNEIVVIILILYDFAERISSVWKQKFGFLIRKYNYLKKLL